MGINDLFVQSKANLSKINANYYVSSFIHKNYIKVDEKGENTAKNVESGEVVTFNRPFAFFVIKKAARMIILSGVYKHP
jgi:serine protease inhibitor